MRQAVLGVLTYLIWAAAAQAGQLGLLVNGRAIHLEQRPGNENEENYGLGLQYDTPMRGYDDWIGFLFSSGFQSSQNEPAYNAGGGLRKRYRYDRWVKGLHTDVGTAAMIIDHTGYRRGGPVFALLPVASVGWNGVAVNAAFIPPVDENVVPLLFFQLMISFETAPRSFPDPRN